MGSRENLEQKENKRSFQVFGMVEGVYSRVWYMEEEKELRKCEESSSWIWREDECRNKMTGEVRYDRGKKLHEKEVTRKVYSKDVIWMGW